MGVTMALVIFRTRIFLTWKLEFGHRCLRKVQHLSLETHTLLWCTRIACTFLEVRRKVDVDIVIIPSHTYIFDLSILFHFKGSTGSAMSDLHELQLPPSSPLPAKW
jgi:hypothetical protein